MATPPKKPTDGATKPPAPRKPATPRKTGTTRKPAAAAAAKPARKAATSRTASVKPAAAAAAADTATKAAVPTSAKRPATRKPAAKRPTTGTAKRDAPASGARKWGIAAVIGGVGAAVTAGLLALRGSTPVDDPAKPNAGQTAHQADGTDSSKSFEAGIADEGTIPEWTGSSS